MGKRNRIDDRGSSKSASPQRKGGREIDGATLDALERRFRELQKQHAPHLPARRASEELAFSHAVLKSQQECSLDGILVVDENGKWLSYNNRFLAMWGIPDEVAANKDDDLALLSVYNKIVDPEVFITQTRALYENPEQSVNDVINLKDGRIFDRFSKGLHTPGGRYLGRVWFFRNVTEQRAALDTLRESEERFRVLAEAMADMIHLNDLQGTIIYANPATERILGFPSEELTGRNALDFVHLEDRELVREDMLATIDGENGRTGVVIRLLKADGSYVCVEVHGFLVAPDGEKKYIGAVLRDITLRKKAEEALELRNREIEDANVSLKVLLRQVSEAREELEERINANIKSLIMPNLSDLILTLEGRPEQMYAVAVRDSINRITSSFAAQLETQEFSFTPREMQVVNYIRHGRSNKDVARLLGVSIRTVEYYRDNIRKKLGLKNRKVNLQSYVASLIR